MPAAAGRAMMLIIGMVVVLVGWTVASRPVSRAGQGYATSGFQVHLNHADEAELCLLPGVGATTAKRIVEYRDQVGGFTRVEDLVEVKWLGPKKIAKLAPFATLNP